MKWQEISDQLSPKETMFSFINSDRSQPRTFWGAEIRDVADG